MANIPAGYYPDPAGSPQPRWWNGSSWGELQSAPYPAQTSPTPYSAGQPFGAVQPYDPSRSYYAASGLHAPEGTNPTTTQAWVLALWPLIGFIDLGVTVALGGFDYSSSSSTSFETATLVSRFITLLTWLGYAALAYGDHRELTRRGVPRPFAWGWGFVPIVYVIGRAVVVYSRTRRGLAPLFVWIGAVLLNWILGFVIGVALSASILNSFYN